MNHDPFDLNARLEALRNDGWVFTVESNMVVIQPPEYIKQRCHYVDDISFKVSATIEGAVSWCEGFLVASLSTRVADKIDRVMTPEEPEEEVDELDEEVDELDDLLDSIDLDDESNPFFIKPNPLKNPCKVKSRP